MSVFCATFDIYRVEVDVFMADKTLRTNKILSILDSSLKEKDL